MAAGLRGALTHKFGRRMNCRLPDRLYSIADYTIAVRGRQVGDNVRLPNHCAPPETARAGSYPVVMTKIAGGALQPAMARDQYHCRAVRAKSAPLCDEVDEHGVRQDNCRNTSSTLWDVDMV